MGSVRVVGPVSFGRNRRRERADDVDVLCRTVESPRTPPEAWPVDRARAVRARRASVPPWPCWA